MSAPDEQNETVDGSVASVIFRNEETGYSILRVERHFTDGALRFEDAECIVLGTVVAVWEGEELHAVGEWVDDPMHGRQFKASSITCITPTSIEGLRRYLASGLIHGIGPKYAQLIVNHFGINTADVLSHHSGRLREIRGIGPKRIAQIRESWREAAAIREVLIFTQTYGITVTKATKIYRRYGNDSIAIIKSDPYRLCRDIWGIGFATADKIAIAVGIAQDSPIRARAAVLHTLQTEAEDNGHCWTAKTELLLHANELVGVSVEVLTVALDAEIADGRVKCEGDKVYLRDLWFAEHAVASQVARLLAARRSFVPIDSDKAVAWWEKKVGFELAPAQREAVLKCLNSKMSIITGGPGVGKTTIIRALVDIYSARKGDAKIMLSLAAPTGRAAKRMTEATGVEAQTLHRLLKYNPQNNEFTYNADRPLPGDVFIFDETSMLDIKLTRDLFAALPLSATVIIVGDTDQLPSVGPGAVLSDLIKCGRIPTTRLTEIFRQASTGLIVRNAHRVNAGEEFETRQGDCDFYFIPQADPAKVLSATLEMMAMRIPRKFKMDPLSDVQVLTPMRRNILGAENLNRMLQERLNGQGAAIKRGDTQFRQGDRVMQLRNNYDKNVYNGDVGIVAEVDVGARSLKVVFEGDEAPVEYGSGDIDELTLAYATTIHKSQGSEYPAVIVVLHSQHYMMLQRNLLYTAITRGRKLVVVIGAPFAVKKAIETNTVRERRTTLAAILAEVPDAQ